MFLSVIKGKKIIIRAPVRSDVKDILKYATDADVARFLPRMPHPYTAADAGAWIDSARRGWKKGNAYEFAIVHREADHIIGGVGLGNVNRKDQNAEVGICVAKEFWGRGIASEAMELILRFAFRTLRLHRVYAIVHEKNTGSVKLVEKLGFVREGTWREGSRLGGRYHNVYAYGLLRSEYRAKRTG